MPGRPEGPYTISDLRPPWLNVARRLQSMARSKINAEGGYAVLSICILVNADGNPASIEYGDPLIWTKPEVSRLEPKKANVLEILGKLSRADVLEILAELSQ